jgi:hypothetical protein
MLENHAKRIGVLGRAAAGTRRNREIQKADAAAGAGERETPGGAGRDDFGQSLLRNLNLTPVSHTVH